MACWTSTIYTVSFQKADIGRLGATLEGEGWKVAINGAELTAVKGGMRIAYTKGEETIGIRGVASAAEHVAAVKRAYAARTVQDAAAKFGWKVEKKTVNGETIKMSLGRK